MKCQKLYIGKKTAVLRYIQLDKCLQPSNASENLIVKMALTVDGADERRNASEYWLHSVTWCMRSGALNVYLMKTDNYDTGVNDV